ncbi:MAG: pilus assembly protein PilP, partial [Deltaproteobacteria bacterium]|nr:pilus assembly protein PilP [Deltaproteobacteria bacterium]
PPPAPPPTPAGGGKRPGTGQPRAQPKRLGAYAKVDPGLRHEFKDRDFIVDPTGGNNRDPFRSFLINQPLTEGDEGSSGDVTEVCPPERSIASKFSVRSLNLIGIVLRGTKSYALFRDTKRFGHIVRRGDCLGKEKAVVNEIGAGYVRLEVTPETPQGTAAPPVQTRTIALYPRELSLDSLNADDGDQGGSSQKDSKGSQ